MVDADDTSELTAIDAASERQAFDEFLDGDAAATIDLASLYQDFLTEYAPERRHTLGVYYTPDAVTRAQVRLVADVLEHRLGCPEAFGDPRVVVVDPAAGSGAYPLAVAANALARGPGSATTLASRLRMCEPMVGAARIARHRLAVALGSSGGIDVVKVDVLAAPRAFDGPILVCLGNPPYDRQALPKGSSAGHRKGGWVRFGAEPGSRPILQDFFDACQAPGLHAKNLYNDYVYFWRWALWAVLEQRCGPGLVSFVTAASYLRGPGFGGMRQRLREAFDELWFIDLEGDDLAARPTRNVFPIRTPVAIAMGVRYAAARPGTPAVVHYVRLDGSRAEKLAALGGIQRLADLPWHSVADGWSAPLTSQPNTDYLRWPKLTDLFPRQFSGAQLKRTWPIGPTPAVVRERWQRLLSLADERAVAFRVTRDRDLDSTPTDLRDQREWLAPLRALAPDAACLEPVRYAYRSFDRHWVLPDARLGDFMRPTLWRMAGPRQIFLTSLLSNVLGRGPAAVATALVPDLDHFRGSFGGRAVIPLWCDPHGMQPNVGDGVLERLAQQYGCEVTPEHLLAYCYALLGTRGFVDRFEPELRTPGPRIPITPDTALFSRTVSLGERLLWLHTFGERCVPPGQQPGCVQPGPTRCLVPVGPELPAGFGYDAEDVSLRLGDGVFGPLSPAAWAYSVSGLHVVRSWLDRRVGGRPRSRQLSPLDSIGPRGWTPELTRELLELLWTIEATLALEPALDAVLDEIVSGGHGQTISSGFFEQTRVDGHTA
jgi:hypothetical protein